MEKALSNHPASIGGNKSRELSTYPNYFLARIEASKKIPKNARRTTTVPAICPVMDATCPYRRLR